MQIIDILGQIDIGGMALPEFQRGYVWNRDQVRGLMESLYRKHPVGSLLSLWKVENYRNFLAARRELLADAANAFLDSLIAGAIPETPEAPSVLDRIAGPRPSSVTSEEEEELLLDTCEWVVQQGLPEGEIMHELVDPTTGASRAVLDLAWPEGLQPGYSPPVALLIDEPMETLDAANRAGYRFFTDAAAFRHYVQHEVLASEPVESK